MALEGMDVDQAQNLAQRLDANAQALAHIAAALTALTAELGHSWLGPASATFQQQWTTQHRAALSDAAQALADMHTRLMANIQQQIRASAANGGPGSSAGTGLAVILGAGWTAVNLLWEAADKIHEIAGNKDVTGRYDKTWTELMKLDHDSPLLKYKQSPILHALHDNPLVQKAGKFLDDTHASPVLEKLEPAGIVIGLVPVGVDLAHVGSAVEQHNYAAAGGDLVDATADGLKDTPWPVTYLAGGTLALLKEDYDMGSKIDWSDIPTPLNADNLRNDYIPTFESLPGEMVGPLVKAFS